jgi:hypothetical protein
LEQSTGVKTNGDVNDDSGTQWYFPLPGYAIGSMPAVPSDPALHPPRGSRHQCSSGTPIHAVENPRSSRRLERRLRQLHHDRARERVDQQCTRPYAVGVGDQVKRGRSSATSVRPDCGPGLTC